MAAVAASGTAAIIVFATMPVLVGALADRFNLDDLQSGLIATLYFSTYAVVALTSPLWVRGWDWRRMGFLGFTIMVASLSVALAADNFNTARLAIACSGLGAGILFPISLTLASDMTHTERVFSIKLTVEQLVPAGLLIAMSLGWVFGSGVVSILSALIVTLIACFVACFALPRRGAEKRVINAGSDTGALPGIMGLAALAIFFSGFAGIWVFLERIATDSGFSSEFTSFWLAVGLITSGIGPLIAALIDDRFGRIWPVLLGTLVALASISPLAGAITEAAYAAVLTLLPLSYYFAISYIMSIIARADGNGKIAGLMSFALAVGSAAGPALFGALRGADGPVLLVMGGCILAGALLIVYVARQALPHGDGELL